MSDLQPRAPEQRGSLTVAARVFEKIAVTVARRNGAVDRSGSFGRGFPRAKADVAGAHVRLELEVASGWGRPLSGVAASLRGVVGYQVQQQTGFTVDAVDVRISSVLAPEAPALALGLDRSSTPEVAHVNG